MGVSALTAGAIEAALATWPDASVSLLDYGTSPRTFEYRSAHGPVAVKLLNMRFSKKIYLPNNIAFLIMLTVILRLLPASLRRRILASNRRLGEIAGVDFAVSISGGDSFSDIYGLERFFYCTLPQLLVQMLGRPLVLLPQTLGPFNGWLSRLFARRVLVRSAAVYSRDYAGLKEMAELLGRQFDPARFRFCYDLGFIVRPQPPKSADLDGFSNADPSSPTVGLNISGLLWRGGYRENNQFGLKANYRRFAATIIEYLISTKNATVLLVPHVFDGQDSVESDQRVCETLYRSIKSRYGNKIYLARGRYDQSEIKYIIGLCDFFIGARMHACIAALSQGIPTVPVAYSKKFTGVMETVGMEPYVADPRTMDENDLLNIVERAWGDRAAIRRHLESTIPEVSARILRLFAEIASSDGTAERECGKSPHGRVP
jgi:polysaccharide pyruvyl transferase WcaK-like protein